MCYKSPIVGWGILFVGLCGFVLFEQFLLDIAGNEFVGGELHAERGASAGNGAQGR